MELVVGLTLDAVLRQRGALPLPVALAMTVGVLDAMHYAHTLKYTLYNTPQHGVIHRDIKPANVIFSGGVPKLMDFGIARPVAVSIHTLHGKAPGTVPYMAPETCTGGVCDFRSDIYQAGLLMYESISGNMAYPQTDMGPVIDAIKTGDRKPLATNSKAAAIVNKCLELDPDKRYQTAQACLADVRALYYIQNPRVTPEAQISAFLSGTATSAEKNSRRAAAAKGRLLPVLKIAAVAALCVLLALAFAAAGFKYGTDFLQTIVKNATAEETSPGSGEPRQPDTATAAAKPPPPAAAPRPKPAAAAPAKQAAAQTASDKRETKDEQAPDPEDALNFINDGKNLLAQNKPQEALAKFQTALKTPSAAATRQEVVRLSIYGAAQCSSILFDQNKLPRENYETAWQSVQSVFPPGSREHAEAAKHLYKGEEQ
jgi:hypothetical protein